MTYTIIGRCPRTGRLGIGIATFSLAVGGYCPSVRPDVGAVSSQAYANPQLRGLAVQALENGLSPGEVLQRLEGQDPDFRYRQVGIVGVDGAGAAWTGSQTRPWAGHATGEDFVAMGNSLSGEATVETMAVTFQKNPGLELDERLLQALEAGRDAGGQSNLQGEHLTERSAGLIVDTPGALVPLDLRVDVHEQAVDELRRLHAAYSPYMPYYELRASDPPNSPAQDVWVRQNISEG
ncbi:MAG: DUF1028 domain-containing protein [Chloroflexi bacterium]|nr:DUF1028 domain-containing protein [Chloroflexota bacterium]